MVVLTSAPSTLTPRLANIAGKKNPNAQKGRERRGKKKRGSK
jgi:hypothetical protein